MAESAILLLLLSLTYQTCTGWNYRPSSGVDYDLSSLSGQVFKISLPNPAGAVIHLSLSERLVDCGKDIKTYGCIFVPRVAPTIIGDKLSIENSEPGKPSAGLKLTFTEGTTCEAMKHKNRKTTVYIQCPETYTEHIEADSLPYKEILAFEGDGADICQYTVTIISNSGCPVHSDSNADVTSVTGCEDSVPCLYTQKCSAVGGSQLSIHGTNFNSIQSTIGEILIGQIGTCHPWKVINDWTIECIVRIEEPTKTEPDRSYKVVFDIIGTGVQKVNVRPGVAIVFNPIPNFSVFFEDLTQFGLAGMRRQAQQIYERVFLSRELPYHILRDLGLSHVKGLLLYGPPGTGKTQLAKALSSVLDAKQVKMLGSPEILNKYVGESEYNMRALFADSQRDWVKYKGNSPFHVIILDEIDAICKPRGRDKNNLGNLVYDSVVNQLLTNMDGLKTQDNLLVIGMTNRFELLDPALLRPGRFEVHIHMSLPDEKERQEILELHLATAKNSGKLSADVNFHKLAQLSVGFTPAQLAGLVRDSQARALHSAQKMGKVSKASVSQADLLRGLEGMGMKSVSVMNDERCSAYASIRTVSEGSSPHTALIQLERNKYIAECLQYLLESDGYFVKVIRPSDVLSDSYLLKSIHNIPAAVSEDKVAVIVVDLCHMLGVCYSGLSPSNDVMMAYLLSQHAFTQDNTKTKTLLAATCNKHCNIDGLKVHFTYVFGMTSVDKLSVQDIRRTNKTSTTL